MTVKSKKKSNATKSRGKQITLSSRNRFLHLAPKKTDTADPSAPPVGQQPCDASGHGQVRTLKDMSRAEIRAIEKQYGCKVQRPD